MKHSVGIDFGTTNCAIGRSTLDGRITPQGPIPSTMAWRNGEYFFGKEALDLLRSDDTEIVPIREIKRLLGCSDITVGRSSIPATEAAARLISHVASRVGGPDEVSRLVIATPITTNVEQRQALREAAGIAGFDDLRLVYEPTAALIGAEGENAPIGRHQVLVVDWGGGTLDLSIVKADDGVFREIAVGGDNFELGGGEIDRAITREFLSLRPDVANRVDQLEGGFERLTAEIEAEKIEVLEDFDGEEGESRYIAVAWMPGTIVELTPRLVFDVVRQFAEKAKELILSILRRSAIGVNEITHVVFAGGTCNCDVIRDSVMGLFPQSRSFVSANSQLLTGIGCTRLAARDFQIQLSAGFGLRQTDGSACIILPAGYPIEQDVYRVVELLVADTDAPHAIIELGVDASADATASGVILNGGKFYALDTLLLKAGSTFGASRARELIKLFVGVDRNLIVTAHANARLSGDSATKSIVGVPLAIRFG